LLVDVIDDNNIYRVTHEYLIMSLTKLVKQPRLHLQLLYGFKKYIFNQAIQNQRNSFSRGFPLPFNVETLQAFGALFQILQYYRKFLYYKTKMLCNYVINISTSFYYNQSIVIYLILYNIVNMPDITFVKFNQKHYVK
jgi:hypothetical protein